MFCVPFHSRYSKPRPWDWLSDAELAALRPFFERQGAGRPIHDLRARLDAIFWVVTRNGPWRELPLEMGPWDTAHRQFRRWARAGVWSRLLQAVANRRCPQGLRRLEHWLCRAFRRALRVLKLAGLRLALRLGLLSALPGPWWMLPKPDLSETWLPLMRRMVARAQTLPFRQAIPWLRELRWMHRFLGGTARIPKCLAPP
jgi:transposase